MVAHADDAHIGPFGQFLGAAVGVPFLEADLGTGAVHRRLDALQRAHAIRRKGAVPVLEHLFGPVAEDGDLLDFVLVQGQQFSLVLQEHDGLLSNQKGLVLEFLALPREVLLRAEFLLVIRTFCIHKAQTEHGAQVGLRTLVHHFFGKETGIPGSLHLLETGIDKTGQAGIQSHLDGFVNVLGVGMHLWHIQERKGTGIIHNSTLHPPFINQDVLDKVIGDTGNAIVGIVGRHQGHSPLLGSFPEAVAIVFAEQSLVKTGIRLVAAVFIAVGQEVLHKGGPPPVSGVVSLDAADLGGHHLAHQIGIFAETLLGTAPAGVAGKVCVRGPKNQAFIGSVLGIEAGLIRHYVTHRPGHFPVPGLSHAISLRESGAVGVLGLGTAGPSATELAGVTQIGKFGVSAAYDTVDGFGGPWIGNAQTRHALTGDGCQFFLNSHQGYGVVQALFLGEAGVLERIVLSGQRAGHQGGRSHKNHESVQHVLINWYRSNTLTYAVFQK